ncbi:hypothetical protein SAMN05216452_2132 [Nitratireductor aquibiodomus]|uniref:Uncharacterized protein n=3 Tax=Nitratireductor TaxID=245876 RepID=A0A1H4KBX0_9HYPH|nr:hypothetical protein SAMN05216452_2132 [Nitratireductor aquibiodomus]
MQGGTTGHVFANRAFMTKILLLLILAMMIVHIIKPLGLPGLRRRADFWKLALIALAAVSLTILLRGGE